jgi:hypothetical protein
MSPRARTHDVAGSGAIGEDSEPIGPPRRRRATGIQLPYLNEPVLLLSFCRSWP